jgi:prepilin-type N-terminal cleavage/methylation domain-containing protein/prepilin-type processing-associated H-X9-DG protein
MSHSPAPVRLIRRAFTLVELLIVIGIIAILISILLPALSRARAQANTAACLSNLRQISIGLVEYSAQNHGCIIPSFNLPRRSGAATNYVAAAGEIMDGWAAILDRDGYVRSPATSTDSVFYCPETVDHFGMQAGQTGTYGANARGWIEWPMQFAGPTFGDSDPQVPVTDPTDGFNKIIRCSYWINAYNPIGGPLATTTSIALNDLYYTACIGYGPDAKGAYTTLHNQSSIHDSSRLITVADGVYMGRQSVDQSGMTNGRIGYRHYGTKGSNSSANAAFADGHAETISTDQFPCAYSLTSKYAANGGTTTFAQQQTMNLTGATIYADPNLALRNFRMSYPNPN